MKTSLKNHNGNNLIAIFSAVAACVGASAFAQGAFQDLDFEEANIGPGQPGQVSVASALPGWTVDYTDAVQNYQITTIPINDRGSGGVVTSIIANGYPSYTTLTPIDGNDSVLLVYGGKLEGLLPLAAVASISQTGQIPIGTQSLLFTAQTFYTAGLTELEVSLGSDVLTFSPVMTQGQSTIYGANIESFAGQTEQLTFSSGEGNLLLDDISFSPVTITPEPQPYILMGIGGCLFALYRRLRP
ncbi:MAG TPA: hypothetical protein VGO67_13070 [Verrucomicrobiae bacterium]|jgi:hypothetical protein